MSKELSFRRLQHERLLRSKRVTGSVTRVSLLVLISLVSGCLLVPPVWDAGDAIYRLDPIEEGVTTKEEVLAELGEPDMVLDNEEGAIFVYRGEATNVVLPVFIPVGGYGTVIWRVTIVFDQEGLVQSVSASKRAKKRYHDVSPDQEDPIEAIRRENFGKQLKKACTGDKSAQYVVAQFYDRGEGVERNEVEAYKWYTLTEADWPEPIIYFKDRLEREMTSSEIAEAERLAAAWRPNQAGCSQP